MSILRVDQLQTTDTTVTVNVEDLELVGNLSDPSSAYQLGYKTRNIGASLDDLNNPRDSGILGDGITNDSAAFTSFESTVSGKFVDLVGRTYLVTTIPTGNKYYNGSWKIGTTTYPCEYAIIRQYGRVTATGNNALRQFTVNGGNTSQSLFVSGDNAASQALTAAGGIVMGQNAHRYTQYLPYSTIAIGRGALENVQPASSSLSEVKGNRNIAIGAYAGKFVTSGYQNVFMGRNCGQNVTVGYLNTAYGTNSMSGAAPTGLTGDIVPENDLIGHNNSGFGYGTLQNAQGNLNTALGDRALTNSVRGNSNTAVGSLAGFSIGSDQAPNGYLYTDRTTKTGTYSQSGTTITINITAHGAVANGYINVAFTSGNITNYTTSAITLKVASVVNSSTLTITSPVSLTTTGSVTQYYVTSATQGPSVDQLTMVGYASGTSILSGSGTTLVGYRAMDSATAVNNATAIGRYSGAFNADGSDNTSFASNVTCLGYDARVTGNNQLQLGNTSTTVYAQSAVQVRSDARDKIVDGETQLGLEFIEGLRPVQGRWNYRSDYFELEEYEDEEGQLQGRLVEKENDGSKARVRPHQWFIAQEVKALADSLGVDFGGFQDHTVLGGCDVQTLAYEEFIPPIVKAIQEISQKQKDIEARLEALENL